MNQMAQMNLLSEMAHNEWYYYGKKKNMSQLPLVKNPKHYA